MMKQMWLIARRDWISTMLSPTGLGMAAIFLVISGYFFASDIVNNQESSMRYTFAYLGIFSIVIIPLLTMRLFSEEFRSGNFEVLVTQPISDSQLVLGKFLAGWLSFIVLTLPIISYIFILEIIGDPDWWMAINGFLGLWMLGMMLTSLGLLFSSTSDNSLLAALGAITVGLLLSSADDAIHLLFGWAGEALAYLSILSHFSLFRRGIFDTRSFFFFFFTAVILLFLTVRIIESRRWKFGVTPDIAKTPWRSPKRSLALAVLSFFFMGEAIISRLSIKYWNAYTVVMALLGIALFGIGCWYNYPRIRREIRKRQTSIALTVLFNCLLGALVWGMAIYISSRMFYRFDMTASQRYELAPLSKQVVSHLKQPVTIYVCISKPTDLLQEIRDLLDEYSVFSDQVTIICLDAHRSPEEAERLRIRYNLSSDLNDELFVIAGDRYRRIAKSSLYFTTALQLPGDRRLLTPAHFIGEAEITSSLIQLTRELPGRVIFLSGHGERNPEKTSEEGISTWVRELSRQYWQVQHMVVTPGGKPQFPPDTQAVIVAGPRRALSNEDLQELNQVLNRGGGILFLLDPGIDSGVEPLIQAWNFRLNNDFVQETQRYTADRGPSSLFINQFSQQHPIGKAMGDLAIVLPTARRVAVTTSNPTLDVSTANFMHTSGYGWASEYDPGEQIQIDPAKDRRGPISVGMAAERYRAVSEPGVDPLQGRIVVIGDSDFVSNRYIDMAGNLDLALNCVEWLAGRHDLLSIRPKVSASQKIILTGREAKFVYWWSILLLPSMVAGAGLLLLLRRRYPS